MEEIYNKLNEKLNDEDKKFIEEIDGEIEKKEIFNGPSEDIKNRYLNNIINKPELEDIKDDNKDDINENIMKDEKVDKITIDTISEYCQYDNCPKKSAKKSKYKFVCKNHQTDGQKIIDKENPKKSVISEDLAAKSLYRCHQHLYMTSEFLLKMFKQNELEGLTQKCIDSKEELMEIHRDIIKVYGVEAVDIISNPLISLALISGSHIAMTYMENNAKKNDTIII